MVRVLEDVVTAEERRAAYLAGGLWDDVRLVDMVHRHASTDPDAVAVVDREGARTRTRAELLADGGRVASRLEAAGVGPREVVSVQLPSSYEFVVVALGILLRGAVLNPLLPNYRHRELDHILRTAGSRALFTPSTYRDFDHAALGQRLRAEVPTLGLHVVVDEDSALGDDQLHRVLAEERPDTSLPPTDAADVSELMFTSGTEAAPKAIMHTEQTTGFSVRTAYTSLGMGPDDVVWMPSPLGHSTGLNYGARFALHHGLELVLQDQWDPGVAATLVEDRGASYTLAATTFLHDLVRQARTGDRDLSSLRLFGCGGAPVPAELVAEAGEHGIQVLRLYGSTEVLVATWNRPGSSESHRRHTDGVAVDDVEVTIQIDDTPVPPGIEGEIHTRGPNTCVGFFDDPERTAASFTHDGWVRSGDLAVMDDEGYLSVLGRKKEIIIRGGLNIAPREVEDVILSHPSVEAAAVVGYADERMGERLCAFLVTTDGEPVTLDELVMHLRAQEMATYKLPERVECVPELPMTASGKVQKFVLAERLAEHTVAGPA